MAESGCGASTAWLSRRTTHVHAVEAPPGDADVEAPLAGGPYDVVIVDVARLSWLEVAPRCLASGGVMVLDDAERPAYAAARERLATSGFLPA